MTAYLSREPALAIARQFRNGDLDLNDAVDRLGWHSSLSFADRTRLLDEMCDELNFEDIPPVVSS